MDSGPGFQSLSVDLGSWFPVVNGVPGFRISQAKISEIFNQKQISLSLNFIVNVQTVYAKTAERRHTSNLKIKLLIDTNWHFLTIRNFLISEMKKFLIVTKWRRQQQQRQCIYLKKYKVYNTLCPVNSYNANLGRARL